MSLDAARQAIETAAPELLELSHFVHAHPEIGYEDWGLWRKMIRAGAKVGYASRPAISYSPGTRTIHEFPDNRHPYYEELMRECP